jgi:hypothetical protein
MIPAAMTSLDKCSEGWSFRNTTAKAHLNEAIAEQQHDHAQCGADWTGRHGIWLIDSGCTLYLIDSIITKSSVASTCLDGLDAVASRSPF